MTKNKSYVQWSVAAEFSFEEFLEFSGEVAVKIENDLYHGSTDSTRIKCIKRSCKCVLCGITATIVRLERQKEATAGKRDGFHFNVYAKVEDRSNEIGYRYVLLTQDHIFPKSLGGPTTLNNLQTMCSACNHKKGDIIDFNNLPVLDEDTKKNIWGKLCHDGTTFKTIAYLLCSSNVKLNQEFAKELGCVSLSRMKQPEHLLKLFLI